MFETRTEIRRAARKKAIAKAREEWERQAKERFRSELREHGVELSKDAEEHIFSFDIRDN